jgi:hypothetical protein
MPVTLDPEPSAALREKLLTEVGTITSVDLAAGWAREALTAKNSLTATDARLVEDAFERRLSELPSSDAATLSTRSIFCKTRCNRGLATGSIWERAWRLPDLPG